MKITAEQIIATGWHEAGHHFAASAFGIPSFPVVDSVEGVIVSESETPKLGACFRDSPGTAYQSGVIGWSGELAESLGGFFRLKSWKPPFIPDERTLHSWHDMMLLRIGNFSAGDRAGILSAPSKTWQTCRSAFVVLTKRKRELRRMARILAKAANEKLTANQPTESPTMQTTTAESKESISFRADALKRFLSTLPPTHPDLERLTQIYNYLRQGLEPPADLFPNITTLNPEATAPSLMAKGLLSEQTT
jgi:hypothetical protein